MRTEAERGREFVEHFGTKGMKWGVRNAASGVNRAVGNAEFRRDANKGSNIKKLVNEASAKTKSNDLPGINAKYAAKGAKVSNKVGILSLSRVPVQKQYVGEVSAAYLKNLNSAAESKTSRSGTKKYTIESKSARRWKVRVKDVEHADHNFEIEPVFDTEGFIVDFRTVDEVAMSIEAGRDFLEHFGTKGMKWGQRKARIGAGLKKFGGEVNELAWVNNAQSYSGQARLHQAVQDRMNDGELSKLNSQPKYRGKNLNTNTKLKNEYYEDHARLSDRLYKEETANQFGTSPLGRQKAHYVNDVDGQRIEFREVTPSKKAKHAADDKISVIFLEADSNGMFIKAKQGALTKNTIKQGEDFVDTLMHYGVKGMQWGKRSSTPTAATAEGAINKGLRSNRTKVKAKGGEGQPAAADAVKAATTKQKLKKSGPAALSNTELRDLATRLQLEQQVGQLASPKGKKFVQKLVKDEGSNQVRREFSEAATAQVKKAKS